jgi:hypothetical protein
MSIVPVQSSIGLAFSITGLALVMPVCFMFRQYFRSLDYFQMTYIFASVLAISNVTFSDNLNDSWVPFPENFLSGICTSGDLVCSIGFQLSFTICLIGVLLILLLIVTIEKCRKPELKFEPVYSFFKGFFRWTYAPLVYYSIIYLKSALDNGEISPIISAGVILGFTFLFPIFQLISYKCLQTEE